MEITISIISLVVSALALIISIFFNFYSGVVNRINRFNESITEIDKLIISNPELLAVYNKEKINADDKLAFDKRSAFILLHFNIFENVYLQFLLRKIIVNRKSKYAWERFILSLFSGSQTNDLWQSNKSLYTKSFVSYIDKLLNKKLNK